MHRLQALRGGVPGGLHHHRGRGVDGRRRAKRYDIDQFKCVYCGFCEEACPVDAIVLTRIFEYHYEKRGDEVTSKEQLLAIGDRMEASIAEDRAQDARYR